MKVYTLPKFSSIFVYGPNRYKGKWTKTQRVWHFTETDIIGSETVLEAPLLYRVKVPKEPGMHFLCYVHSVLQLPTTLFEIIRNEM